MTLFAKIVLTAFLLPAPLLSTGQRQNDPLWRMQEMVGRGERFVYVIEGYAYDGCDSSALNTMLNKYDLRRVVRVDILRAAATTWCTDNSAVILRFAEKQRPRIKRQLLARARTVFSSDGPFPLLFIDNEQMPQAEAEERLSALAPRKIFAIDIKEPGSEFLSPDENNGMIRVWTTP